MSRWNALLAIIVLGYLLAACGGDTDDNQTATPASAAVLTATMVIETVSPSPTVAVAATPAVVTPTVVATTTPTVPASPTAVAALPFRVEIPVAAYPVDAAFVTLERWTWAPFGGTDEFAETGPGRSIGYLDAGTEICFIAPIQGGADATIYRSGGTSETISSDITQPTTVNAGDVTVYGDNNASNCKNAGQTRSVTIVAGIWRVDPTLDVTLPGALTGQVLAKGAPIVFPAEPVSVTIERVLMDDGSTMALPDGAIVLVFVEDGAVALTGAAGSNVSRGIGMSIEQVDSDEVVLEADDGAQLTANGSLLTASKSSSVIIVTIASAP